METESPLKYDWSNKTILIVEDVNHNYKFLLHAFKPTNAKVLWAKNGKEAYDLCKTDTRIDVILMDIDLPGISGIEGIRRIKKISNEILILILTVYDENDLIFEALCAGACVA